ncbi:hypothetical protein EDD93_3657 [Streptomyces sp. 840.1]|uniref:hypothetical protein n=1 Tax=Streptomyces sp. 840.1 TaxID=2485152 RepID=UPI000F96F978|nr:hypothetical protein [Streptomyces sp. 840.1]ROQ69160.1 hypothetical protein EDD93_3657 [Streptomyces sp. 840.1]
MAQHPEITVALVRELLNSPAGGPVLYIDETGQLAVGSEIHAPRSSVVATREEASDYFGEHHVDGLDDDTISDLLPGTEDWVENTLAALND